MLRSQTLALAVLLMGLTATGPAVAESTMDWSPLIRELEAAALSEDPWAAVSALEVLRGVREGLAEGYEDLPTSTRALFVAWAEELRAAERRLCIGAVRGLLTEAARQADAQEWIEAAVALDSADTIWASVFNEENPEIALWLDKVTKELKAAGRQ